MADFPGGSEPRSPNLTLTAEEQRLYGQVFSAADTDGIGVVTGDNALKFLPDRTKLPSEALGEIWQIADTEDKGFLTPSGFYIVLRLIGYAQAGRTITSELVSKPGGPVPKIEGINSTQPPASPLQAQGSGGPVKVPPLAPDKAGQYAALFQQSGAQDGLLPGATAKQIFDRAQVPNDILVRIWNLADTEQRGKLSTTEFIIAMHLLASYRIGAMRALPRNLPAGLWDAAARRGPAQRPPSSGGPIPSAIPRQFSGPTTPRTSSPLASRPAYTLPQTPVQAQATGDWAISPQEKAQYDGQFAKLDTQGQGFVSGEQAVTFFGNSRLPEDDLASIWDLADTKSRGQLNAEEFAVAMHLIRNQLQNRGPVPKALPPNLIPPSSRQSLPTQAPPQPPAPQSSAQKPKSAAEDLFGLDALTDAPPAPAAQAPTQAPQSTGGSFALPPQPTKSPPPVAPQNQSTVFKPFVPSSSFGQSIVSPQATGSQPKPVQQQQQQTRGVEDDLLGDTDPEVSKRLTNETTELANLSTQIGNLTNQMQDVKSKRSNTDSNLTSVSTQKRDFEARLAQLRTAYEQEAREVRNLEEKLATSRNETKKAQSDLAMVQHSYNNLQEQKQQLAQALEGDQKENASLQERMREINAEINQIKPQIEKVKTDARQQKGLVAINKKQLNTNEQERDRLKTELDSHTREHEEATKELEESHRSLQSRQTSFTAPVASPTGSTASQNTNPFFRRPTTGSSDRGMTRSPLAEESASSPNHSAFDSFFGSSFPAGDSTTEPPPPVAFGAPLPQHSAETALAPAKSTSSTSDQSEPHTPTQPTLTEMPSSSHLPPPPPQSRQITSSSLPLNEGLQPPGSPTSSVGVAPPASRFGEGSGYNTPVRDRQVSQTGFSAAGDGAAPMSPLSQAHEADSSTDNSPVARSAPAAEPAPFPKASDSRLNTAYHSGSIPGSFPGDVTPSGASANGSATGSATEAKATDDPFGRTSPPKRADSKDDFDSAFAGFENKGKAPMLTGPADTAPSVPPKDEFPPIQEFDNDSDSDSDHGKGFEDDFTASPAAKQGAASALAGGDHRPEALRNVSQTSQLPTPNAEQSPPTYDQTIPPPDRTHSGSNQFPAEFNGLLPSREDPTSRENAVSSPVQATSASIASFPAASEAKPTPPPKDKNAFDDFDNDFVDLSDAHNADEKTDDDLGASRHHDFSDEFNPTFDSPAPSKMTTSSMFGTDSTFDNFENSVSGPAHASGTTAGSGGASVPPTDSDWDSMFANLGKDGGMPPAVHPTNNGVANAADTAIGTAPAPASATLAPDAADSSRPALARAVSTGTEHDDPILKRLTAMGYPRDQSLLALEKFDYHLDKAADYLTQQ